MQVWLMQLYVRKVRKTASIRVFSKATPIRCAARMPVLPARTLSGALLPRDIWEFAPGDKIGYERITKDRIG